MITKQNLGVPQIPMSMEQVAFHALLMGCKPNQTVQTHLAKNEIVSSRLHLILACIEQSDVCEDVSGKIHSALILENIQRLQKRNTRIYYGLSLNEIESIVQSVLQNLNQYIILPTWQEIVFGRNDI